MKVAVTGGAGFIGSNLVSRLLGLGAEIVVLDDLSTGSLDNLRGMAVDFRRGSVLDEEALSCLDDAESIVHLAAVPSVPRSIADPMASHEANATGTLKVLEKAKFTGAHVIVASSSSVYGANPEMPKRESMRPMPVSPYAVSKLAAESYAISFQQCYGLPTLAFRFFNVYGPRQAPDHAYAAVVPAFASAAILGRSAIVHGDGRQTRDFTFVGAVVETLVDALRRRVFHQEPVNLAFGTRHSLLGVLEQMEAILNCPIARTFKDTRPGDVRDSQADSTLFRSLFPDLEPVQLDQGLKETLEWMKTRQIAHAR